MSKEKPILFKPELVRAILDGRKTMTRRLIKRQPDPQFSYSDCKVRFAQWWDDEMDKIYGPSWLLTSPEDEEWTLCHDFGKPKYEVGDILWVRETFAISGARIFYQANNNAIENAGLRGMYDFKWKPSIHMPYSACRLFLKVTDIKVERACDISHEDAIREGCSGDKEYEPKEQFKDLWSTINGPETWENWVWVYTFEVIKTT